jgi:hypothetical protein
MSDKPTTADAELILKLYDLRREPEMRKARNWWLTSFWPTSADEILKISANLGSQENNWLRQVGGYWEMAASFAVRGVLSSEMFLDPSFSGEMFLYYGKIRPYLKEFREKLGNPRVFSNVENVINNSPEATAYLKVIEERIATLRKAKVEAAA